MKVIHLISGGDTGGAKTHVLTLLDNLRKMNIDAELLCIMEGIFTPVSYTHLTLPTICSV